MEKVFIITVLVVFFYGLIKFIESKYFTKEKVPLKYTVRDGIFVALSAFCGGFILFNMEYNISDFISMMTGNKSIHANTTQIFTDDPGF
jgi:hypothetical protein